LIRCGSKAEVQESATICFQYEELLISKYHLPLPPNVKNSKTVTKILKKGYTDPEVPGSIPGATRFSEK
jgi:hypothetical protein